MKPADFKNLIKEIGSLIDKRAETTAIDMKAHVSTEIKEAKTELKADIKKVRAEMATKGDVLDVGVKIDKMKRRIEILEEDADLPNPHKN